MKLTAHVHALFVAVHLFCCVGLVRAQQVSPAVIEYPGVNANSKTDGHFDLANDSLEPLFVTIEAKSFTINSSGDAVFTQLQPAIHLELSATSVRLSPKQRRTIYYKVNSTISPAWFCIYSNFSGLPKRNGMNVQLELPHTVYLLSKDRPKSEELAFTNVKQTVGKLTGTIMNRSKNVVRVLTIEASGEHLKKSEGGFPLLPGGTHNFAILFPEAKTISALRAKTSNFHVDMEMP